MLEKRRHHWSLKTTQGPKLAPQFSMDSFAGAIDEHANTRPIRIWRIYLEHHGHLAGCQADQVADRVDADQLHKSSDEILLELRAVVTLQHRENTIGWRRVLVHTLGSHGVVDVRDAGEHGRQVERGARYACGVAGSIQTQMVLTG